jgi:hypothetical protein
MLGGLRGDPPIKVRPDDTETVALLAVERHDVDVVVVAIYLEIATAII